MVMVVIMLQQRVAEVVVEIAVDTMHVIGPVLRVVVLNHERRALNQVVMRLTRLETAGPEEMDLLRAGPIDPSQVLIRELLANASDVYAHELHQDLTLLDRQVRHGHAARLAALDPALVAGNE